MKQYTYPQALAAALRAGACSSAMHDLRCHKSWADVRASIAAASSERLELYASYARFFALEVMDRDDRIECYAHVFSSMRALDMWGEHLATCLEQADIYARQHPEDVCAQDDAAVAHVRHIAYERRLCVAYDTTWLTTIDLYAVGD